MEGPIFAEHPSHFTEDCLDMFDVLECKNDRDLVNARLLDALEMRGIVDDIGDLRSHFLRDLDQCFPHIHSGHGCPLFMKSSGKESLSTREVENIIVFLRINQSQKMRQEHLSMIGV